MDKATKMWVESIRKVIHDAGSALADKPKEWRTLLDEIGADVEGLEAALNDEEADGDGG